MSGGGTVPAPGGSALQRLKGTGPDTACNRQRQRHRGFVTGGLRYDRVDIDDPVRDTSRPVVQCRRRVMDRSRDPQDC
jgi:hypothetical protein